MLLQNNISLQSEEHTKSVHLQNKCEQCTYASSNKYDNDLDERSVREGMKRNEPKDKVCGDCGYATSFSHHLELHVTAVHKRINGERGPHRSSSFSSPTNLRKHLKAIHDKSRDEHCDLCTYSTSSKYALRDHISAGHLNLKNCIATNRTHRT